MMLMTFISSPSNPRIRALQHLHGTRGRKKSGLFLMEGPHLLGALLDVRLEPHEIYYQPALLQRTAEGQQLLWRMLHTANIRPECLIEVSERVMEVISDAQTAQGVVCVLAMDAFTPERMRQRRSERQRSALLILDDLADPGNMGTILRTALAADVDEVLLTAGCVDYYSPKVVRAAAGAHVALPVGTDLSWAAIEERVRVHCAATPRVLLAEAGSPHLYYEQDLTSPFA